MIMSAAGGCRPQRKLAKDYFFLAAFFVAFFFVATHITPFRGHVRGYGLNSRTQTRVILVLTYFFPFLGACFAAFFFAAMYLTSFRHHIPSAVFTIFQTTDGVEPPFP